MSQLPNPTDTDQNVLFVLYQGTWKELFALALALHAAPKWLQLQTENCQPVWALSRGRANQGSVGIHALRLGSLASLEYTAWILPVAGAISLCHSCSNIWTVPRVCCSLSLPAGMFILSLFPSRWFLLMTHNIQTPCSLVKCIQVMELH